MALRPDLPPHLALGFGERARLRRLFQVAIETPHQAQSYRATLPYLLYDILASHASNFAKRSLNLLCSSG